jgi:hypothetical protein
MVVCLDNDDEGVWKADDISTRKTKKKKRHFIDVGARATAVIVGNGADK